MKKILILGGSGNTGKQLASLLLQYSDAEISIAGRDFIQASAVANNLFSEKEPSRVKPVKLDASSFDELKNAFNNIDIVLVASSTAKYVENIVNAALETNTDYYDINISKTKLDYLKSKNELIKQKNLCFITDGGCHPGLPALMARFIKKQFDSLEKANVAAYMKIDWKNLNFSDETITEFVSEFKNYDGRIFKKGGWKRSDATDFKRFDFGKEFGIERCSPMCLDEMKTLPEIIPTLRETGFYISGFNWFVDWLIALSVVIIFPLFKNKAVNTITKLFHWGLKKYSKPPYGIAIKLEAEGMIQGQHHKKEMVLEHNDAYFMTAASVVTCLKQILDGTERKSGLYHQAHIAEPERLIEDLRIMGIKFQIT